MAKSVSRKASNFMMIGESILNLLSLPLGIYAIVMGSALVTQVVEVEDVDAAAVETLEQLFDPRVAILGTFLFLLLLVAARVLRGFRLREKKGEGFLRLSLAQGAAFTVAGLLPVFLGYTLDSTTAAAALCGVALAAGRVYAIVRNRKARSIVFNVLAILAIAYCATAIFFIGALLFLLAVFALMSIVFSRISFDVLKKIVVKTHAAEIIFGLILLIVTFALLLVFFEPNINDFLDALWYCFAIVTTIGFGDLTAVTIFGRILSVILGAYGIIVVALITSIIVNFYGEMKTSPDAESGGAGENGDNAEAGENPDSGEA